MVVHRSKVAAMSAWISRELWVARSVGGFTGSSVDEEAFA